MAKIDVTQKAFGDKLTGDFGVFGSSFKNNDIFDSQALFYSADAMNPTYPYDKLNGSWVKNGAASQVNPPGILLKERNDTKNMNFNARFSNSSTCISGVISTCFYSLSVASVFAISQCNQRLNRFALNLSSC